MKPPTFYEQVGIVIPGSVFLLGVLYFAPTFRALFSADGISIGGLGLFLTISYALGHAVAAVGNLLETIYWSLLGGMPTDWIVTRESRLLGPKQMETLRRLIHTRLGIDVPQLRELNRRDWKPVFGQLYRDVLSCGAGRIDTFNGNYGLNRGLAASVLCLIPVIVLLAPADASHLIPAATILAAIFVFRMHRFGVYFAREVYFCFLNLPPSPKVTQPMADSSKKS